MSRVNHVLAGVAALLGGLAGIVALAGHGPGTLDQPLARVVETSRLPVLELAAWLRDRRPGLTILDVRPDSGSFEEFHLPRARHAPLATLRAAARSATGTVIVYADGSDLAARAWLMLRSLGHDSVRVMPDGVGEWLSVVLNPVLPSDATPEARAAFARQAELSRYFGGLPRIVESGATSRSDTGSRALLRRTTRRGCAF